MKTQMNQEKKMSSTERIAIADSFIRKHKLSDEDLCQDIYLTALENPSFDVVALREAFTNILAARAQSASVQNELPNGLLIGIVRDTTKTFDSLIKANNYAGFIELLSTFMS